MDTTPTRPLVVIADEVMSLAPVSPLWAACAVPGRGPEYRFTGARRGYLHRAVAALRMRRTRRRLAGELRQLHRAIDARYRHQNGDRSC